MSTPVKTSTTKADALAAERLLSKAVSISRCHLAVVKTESDYKRVYDENRSRFYNAIVAASTLVEDPTPKEN